MLVVAERRELAKQHGACTTARLHAWFKQCKWSPHSEKMTQNFLELSCNVHILTVGMCRLG